MEEKRFVDETKKRPASQEKPRPGNCAGFRGCDFLLEEDGKQN
jgi:hypothetical protein